MHIVYTVEVADQRDALGIMHRFNTAPALTNPEMSIWDFTGYQNILSYTNIGTSHGVIDSINFYTKHRTVLHRLSQPLEKDRFIQMVMKDTLGKGKKYYIGSIASTDKQDLQRVALNYFPKPNALELVFYRFDDKMTDDDRALLAYLFDADTGRKVSRTKNSITEEMIKLEQQKGSLS